MISQWDESLTTGIESVDEQHRQMVAILSDLLAAMQAGRARSEVGATLERLGRYTQRHFRHEEDWMDRLACPAASENRCQHAEFLSILAQFVADFEADGPSVGLIMRVHDQLAWWLETHIRGVDVQLLPCVRRASAGQASADAGPAGTGPAGTGSAG
jgi:hemerythrin-like metal-binding protein